MDARPTPEQRELDDAAIRLAEKLGPTAVGDLDDADRRERLDAALVQAGWRELRTGTPLRTARLRSGSRARRPLARPWRLRRRVRRAGAGARSPAPLGRRGAWTTRRARWRSPQICSGLARGSGIAVDAAGSSAALALDVTGTTVVEVAIVPTDDANEVDLTRRTSRARSGCRAVARHRSRRMTSWRGRRSPSPSPRPTSSA